jgi:iron complex outermembrane receptor protein
VASTAPGANRCIFVPTSPRTGGNMSCIGPASGNRAPLSPKLAMALGFTYTLDVGAEGQVIANGLWSYTTNQYFEADERLDTGKVSVFNASIEYKPSPTWGVELFMNNIGDKQYYVTGTAGGNGDQGALAAPRTYGVNLKFDF